MGTCDDGGEERVREEETLGWRWRRQLERMNGGAIDGGEGGLGLCLLFALVLLPGSDGEEEE